MSAINFIAKWYELVKGFESSCSIRKSVSLNFVNSFYLPLKKCSVLFLIFMKNCQTYT